MLDATPFLKLYATRRARALAELDGVESQRRILLRLLRTARATRFGEDHGFRTIGSIEDYQAAVPLRDYDRFRADYWGDTFPRLSDCTWPGTIPFFAESSGTTTGITKYIPCSRQMVRANVRAAMDVLVHHLQARPDSHVFGGKNFMLGGSTGLTDLTPGVRTGDLSGIAMVTKPLWARPWFFPPRSIDAIDDWEERLEVMVGALQGLDVRSMSGTPSWLLVLFDRLADRRPDLGHAIAAHFPKLELIIHGGVNFEPYRATYAERLSGSDIQTREVYPASEGFIAVADRGDGEGMRLTPDNDLFFEFVPVEELESDRPTRHWFGNVETGVDYALVLTTCSGLWSYVIGDTVRLVDTDPARVLVTGRTSYMLSAFGEHLIDEEIEVAVAKAAAQCGATVREYSVGPIFPKAAGDRGRHLYIVELEDDAPAVDRDGRFGALIDDDLQATNLDYHAYRSGERGLLDPPTITIVPPGTFYEWMKARGKLGGQNKVPRVISDPEMFEELRAFVESR